MHEDAGHFHDAGRVTLCNCLYCLDLVPTCKDLMGAFRFSYRQSQVAGDVAKCLCFIGRPMIKSGSRLSLAIYLCDPYARRFRLPYALYG
jgi:hypothetical protein